MDTCCKFFLSSLTAKVYKKHLHKISKDKMGNSSQKENSISQNKPQSTTMAPNRGGEAFSSEVTL